MSMTVFALVMMAALIHASWNAIVKSGADKHLTTMVVAVAAGALSALVLPFIAAPAASSWPYLSASVLLQILYFVLVARAYASSDMSQAYPLMRGSAPVLVTLVSVFAMHEPVSARAWCGVIAISIGILSMTLGSPPRQRRGVLFALGNALVIAAYTLVDGIGARRSGAPVSYTLWIFFLSALPLLLWTTAGYGAALPAHLARRWRVEVLAGTGAVLSYALALWAMTLAPIALVAALRETSIVFGALIAGLVLKERVSTRRIGAAVIIAAGAALLRIA